MEKCYAHVKGTVDFYPPQSNTFRNLVDKAATLFKLFGYEEIILPILEEEKVFSKSIGETTDIIEKQIFRIKGKDIILRPEATAQVVRFYLEHSLHKKRDFHKFFYAGPMFRGERPQKGRLRQFHHIGGEVLGSDSPYADVEVIQLARLLLKQSGVDDFLLKINSLGCEQDKKKLIATLKKKLASYKDEFCDLCKRRMDKNPLRVFDCKQKKCQNLITTFQIEKEYLCAPCREHFAKVRSLLDGLGIYYTVDSKLVRGLDYYTNTVFELQSPHLGAQNACGGGGRYNNLVKTLGGPAVPATGFALGVERILLLIGEQKEEKVSLSVYVVYTSGAMFAEAFSIVQRLRAHGITSSMHFNQKTLKAQLRFAEKTNAPFTVIVGDEEFKEKQVILRDMRASRQEKVSITKLIERLQA